MKGTITAIIRRAEGVNGGFGFLVDEDGAERFFHARVVRGEYENKFESLEEGLHVTFEPFELPGTGLRARNVEVIR